VISAGGKKTLPRREGRENSIFGIEGVSRHCTKNPHKKKKGKARGSKNRGGGILGSGNWGFEKVEGGETEGFTNKKIGRIDLPSSYSVTKGGKGINTSN